MTLFASPKSEENASPSDGPSTNFPLLSALAEHAIPGYGAVEIVFDGNLLTAAREHRAGEISALLDVAVASGKVAFATDRAPFTSALEPAHAAERLKRLPTSPLSEATRRSYWSLLSVLAENRM